jgi:SnoaL-like domain
MVDDGSVTEHDATRADMLAAVERSPVAAAARDRGAWVGVFAQDAQIEDPIGSRPHRGADEIARFYDTFIGPREITFHRDVDLIVGTTVVRDMDLELKMAPTLIMRVPAYLRYDVDRGGNIIALQALWELPAMVLLFAKSGLAAIPAGAALSRGLLNNQGLTGTVGFLSGFRGVGKRGRRRMSDLLDVACAGDEVAARNELGGHVPATLGDHDRLATSDLVARLAGGRPSKILAAGNTVAARVDSGGKRSVLIAEMRPAPLSFSRIRLFAEGE